MSQTSARHFAPSYVLRSFEAADDEQHASAAQTTAKDGKGVNVYRVDQGRLLLHADPDAITPKARLDDLYVDPSHAAFKALEKSMSQLEADALGVVRTIVYSISKSKPNVQITRRALNTLHRFLFVMWCRHTDRGAQLIHGPHDERTKQALNNHIARTFGGKPAGALDVWLQNLRELLDDRLANVFTNEKIFLPDRQAFEADVRLGRLALWRSAPDVDFITAFNCCGLYDGWPADGSAAGEVFSVNGRAVLARAKVFPLHPNLALAILHPSLTNSGVSPAMYDTLLSRGSSPLGEFPAFAPDVRYASLSPAARKAQRTGDTKALESGGKKTAPDESGSHARRIDGKLLEAREDDMLTFAPAHLSARQTLLVNALVLHTAAGGVVFRSPRQLHHALAAYSKDFATWGPKQDYARLQELLRLHEQGKPLPEDLALPAPERRSATPEPMSPPMSPASSRPGSPLPGRKSVRQRRREREERKLMRQALGIASPPMSSPALSELDLPDESILGSPMSDPATLVEASPVLKSIEAALESEIPELSKLRDAEKQPEDEQERPEKVEQPVPLEAIAEEDAPAGSLGAEPEEVARPESPVAEPEEVARPDSPAEEQEKVVRPESPSSEPEQDVRSASPAPELEVHEVAALPLDTRNPLPLGDVFPEEEAKAVLREALGHFVEEEHEEYPLPQAEVPVDVDEQDESREDDAAEVMAYVPPTFDAAEHEAVARAALKSHPEDPFDDSHAVHDHDHDEQEGSHAQAVEHTLHHRPASPPPAVPFRAGHQRSPPLTPLDLEALVGKVHEVYDMANTVNQAGARVAQDLTDVARIAVVKHADDVLVPIDDDEALETASTSQTRTSSVWTSGASEGAIPDIEITPVAHSQTSEEEQPPRITVTPPTPAVRPLPEVEVDGGAEMRQRVAVAEKREPEKPATESKQQPSEKEKDRSAVQQYTLTQKVIVWMVLLFLIMFAFPFIVLRTAFNVVMAHRGRGAEDGAGQQQPAGAATGTGTSHEL